MTRWMRVLVAATLISTLFAFAADWSRSASTARKPAERVIYMSAVEWKGKTNVSKEPFPTAVLPEGAGYGRVPPDTSGEWGAQTYRFDSAAVAVEGERVTLKIFGVNGAEHAISIPAFGKKFTVRRGELTTVSFVAKKAGIFKIVCHNHPPSMVTDLVVLRRASG